MDEDDMTFEQLRAAMLAGRPAEVTPGPPPHISSSSTLVIGSSTTVKGVFVEPISGGRTQVIARGTTRSWSAPRRLPV